jgi:hypothetical protein
MKTLLRVFFGMVVFILLCLPMAAGKYNSRHAEMPIPGLALKGV